MEVMTYYLVVRTGPADYTSAYILQDCPPHPPPPPPPPLNLTVKRKHTWPQEADLSIKL